MRVFAHEGQDRAAEIRERFVAAVVCDVLVHQPQKSFDEIEVRQPGPSGAKNVRRRYREALEALRPEARVAVACCATRTVRGKWQ